MDSINPQKARTEPVRAETLTIEDLAQLLHRAPSTIATEASKSPHKLPPRLRLPNSRKVLWLRSDVEAWINEYRT